MPTPLERYPLFHTADLDCARAAVARIFTEHRLELLDAGVRLEARMNSRRLSNTTFNFLSYGARTRVQPLGWTRSTWCGSRCPGGRRSGAAPRTSSASRVPRRCSRRTTPCYVTGVVLDVDGGMGVGSSVR